jgi:surfeit locus 1 family protein
MPLPLLRRFHPSLGLSLAAIPAMGVLLALGTWQMDRMQWKENLISERSQRLAAPPVNLPAQVAAPEALEYRRAQAVGRFLHDREMYLAGRSNRGQSGYHVVTPLQRADGSAVLVNRGWVPLDRKLPQSRDQGQVDGQVTVQGLARVPPAPGWITPANQVEGNFWFYVDIPAMAKAARLANVLPVYIEAGPTPNPGGLPVGGQPQTNLPNNHLQYAITWYLLAVALGVIYVLRSMKEE